jgi:hypothetical protein
MVDWITAKVPLNHTGEICDGRILKLSKDGLVDYEIRTWLPVEGSHSSSISIKTIEFDEIGNGTTLMISGNPVKLFQGHNIFGTDDVCGLIYETMNRLCSILEIEPSPEDIRAWQQGEYSLSRIDINAMYTPDLYPEIALGLLLHTPRSLPGPEPLTSACVAHADLSASPRVAAESLQAPRGNLSAALSRQPLNAASQHLPPGRSPLVDTGLAVVPLTHKPCHTVSAPLSHPSSPYCHGR